jgi:hypothetical protein
MTWTDALVALVVSHVVGDILVQSDWQAVTKNRGLRDPVGRTALLTHVATYTVTFVPALVWIGTHTNAGRAVIVGALVAVPHLVIDDGSLVRAWLQQVKNVTSPPQALVIAVDQSFHLLCLTGAAIVAAA